MQLTPPLERVPIEPLPPLTERERIHAAAMTVCSLMKLGEIDGEVSKEEVEKAQQIFEQGRPITEVELKTPGLVLHLEALLTKYDHEIVHDAVRLRRYVTNRLIHESDDKDPRIRMRALEMLGKIGDVGLFVERMEVNITSKPTAELEARLNKLLNPLKDIEGESEIVMTTPEKKKSEALDLYNAVAALPSVDLSNVVIDDG